MNTSKSCHGVLRLGIRLGNVDCCKNMQIRKYKELLVVVAFDFIYIYCGKISCNTAVLNHLDVMLNDSS